MGTNRRVSDGKAEKAGESQGLDIRQDSLQRAPEDLGAHVNTKRRLHRDRSALGQWVALRQGVRQGPLVGDFVGTLPDCVGACCLIVRGVMRTVPSKPPLILRQSSLAPRQKDVIYNRLSLRHAHD